MRKALTNPKAVLPLLWIQFIPIILFPPDTFDPQSQEWWLPALLTAMALWGLLALVIRRTQNVWPWYLMAFGQGFNIISRMMMLLSHVVVPSGGQMVFNSLYVTLTILSMLFSAFMLWYLELPEVRVAIARR